MLIINYNGNKPISNSYNFSVNGNNNADVIKFVLNGYQGDLLLVNYSIYANIQNELGDFIDKVELDLETLQIDEDGILSVELKLMKKHTENKSIFLSLSFEDESVVWKTQTVKININCGVSADEEIANNYPTILQQLEERIRELEQGGGSSGVSDVAIERVWLTYTKKTAYMKLNYLAGYDNNGSYTFNDPADIFLNIKTSVIDSKIEEQIKNNRFVIRFDYPQKHKSILKWDADNSQFKYFSNKEHRSPNNFRAGYRSFTNSLYSKVGGEYIRIQKADLLLNSLIFVKESDIKTNNNGEKYIHIQMTFADYIKKLYTPTTDYQWIDDVRPTMDGWEEDIAERYIAGLPSTATGLEEREKLKHFNAGSNVFKSTTSRQISVVRELMVGGRFIPCYNAFAPMVIQNNPDEFWDGTIYDIFDCPFTVGRKTKQHYLGKSVSNNYFQVVRKNGSKMQKSTGCITAVKPRCCILTEDYLTNTTNMWAKKYSQSTQNIRTFCKSGIYKSDFAVMAFRVAITRK